MKVERDLVFKEKNHESAHLHLEKTSQRFAF